MSDAHREPTADNGKANEPELGAAASTDRAEQSLGLEDVRFEEDERATLPQEARQTSDAPKLSSAAASGGAITVHVVGRTDVGLVREHNEDNYLLADLATGSREPSKFGEVPHAGLLFAVCDGMGGAAAGEVASQMAVDTIFEMMRRSVPAQDRDSFARALVRSVEEAGTRIFEGARADRTRRGMGTTSTVSALMDKTLFVGQVGDSRAYVLRNGELKQVTKDQSLVNQLIEAGQLTEAEAEAFEHSNIILQALGTTDQVTVDLTFLELRRGDRLMMCSDGLSGLVHGDVIRDVMVEYRDLSACCERLIELAKAGGGHDNVTVILCEFGGEGLQPPVATDLAGYQQYPLPLSDDGRGGAGDSASPTLAPPTDRSRGGDGYDDFGDITGASRSASASGARYIVLGLMALALAGAAYYFMANAQKTSALPKLTANATAPVAVVPEPPTRVEVVVRTDVEGGELVVDGESFGTGNEGRWVLDLAPGPHKLDARAGGSVVTTMLVTVREGIPATVLLSMPEGALAIAEDAGDAAEAKPDPEAEARKRRRAAAAAAAAADDGGVDRRAARRKRRPEEGTSAGTNEPSGVP